MSKRIPVYLSESELSRILEWFDAYSFESLNDKEDDRLEEKLLDYAVTFEE